jgi:hypothetical protein
LGWIAPKESEFLLPPLSAFLTPPEFAPLVAAGGAEVDAPLLAFGAVLFPVLGDVDDFGLLDTDADDDADADAWLRSAQLVLEGDAVLVRPAAAACEFAVALAVDGLAGVEVCVLGLPDGLDAALDEFAGLDGLAGVGLTGGLDVFGAVLEDVTGELAEGRQDGPADGCLFGAVVA